jgi:hypothetical protein
MAKITIKGKQYTVSENLRYQHGASWYAKFVITETGERLAIKDRWTWRWWTTEDRLQLRPFRSEETHE